ncbi:protein LEO1 homolog isoform X1 [Salvia splendens]|uniref:protein LEO1 homolog isoform X1 n=2 Tax=Salvia splendens TaxID=180675 RepID=UPI001C28036D|nr:protein LEO1 homolog isoform X1 [Salvia splendens]XP_041997243.1 protein LEO1 homolog isoform X1 [Salvia splendens]XP_041997245.1 protein LEO1 homolog isoform X1 [Salvia splendens]
MNREQILQNLFGYLSEEESASSHEMNHQPEFNPVERDEGTEHANDAISSPLVVIDGGLQLNEDAISSRSSNGGFEHHTQTTPEGGAKLHHEGGSTCNCDEGGPMSDNKSTFRHRVKTEGGAEFSDEAGGIDKETSSSMLLKTENGKDQARIADVMRALFGDSDEEPGQYEAEFGTDQGKNNSISPEHKLSYEGDLESEGTVSSEHTQFGPKEEEEKAEDKPEGESKDKPEEQSIGRLLVVEFPNRTPLAHPSQMATTELSNIIAFDSKPFDPTTYSGEDIYITDASGSERFIPSTNIVQWRNVVNSDGTISLESNARIVNWSDGSFQLLIGKKAFDVTEEVAQKILSHSFFWHEGIYRSLVSFSKSEKVASSSVVSDPDSSTVHGDRETTPKPETEQFQQDGLKATEDNLSLNQKSNDKEMTSNHNNPEEVSDEHMWPSEAGDINLERQKDRQTKKRRPRRG